MKQLLFLAIAIVTVTCGFVGCTSSQNTTPGPNAARGEGGTSPAMKEKMTGGASAQR